MRAQGSRVVAWVLVSLVLHVLFVVALQLLMMMALVRLPFALFFQFHADCQYLSGRLSS